MKYKEFKTEVEKLGMKIVHRPWADYIVSEGEVGWLLASVSREDACSINTQFHGCTIPEISFRQLFRLLVKFAQTSIEERHYDDV